MEAIIEYRIKVEFPDEETTELMEVAEQFKDDLYDAGIDSICEPQHIKVVDVTYQIYKPTEKK